MVFVLMIIVVAITIVIYPKKGTFISKLRLKALSMEFEICTKEKSDPPSKDDHFKKK